MTDTSDPVCATANPKTCARNGKEGVAIMMVDGRNIWFCIGCARKVAPKRAEAPPND